MSYLIWCLMVALVFLPPLLIKNKTRKPEDMPKLSDDILDALLLLNLPETAGEQQIRNAHRRMIQKNHPDLGGSLTNAAHINHARDILLKNLGVHIKQAA